jgi:carboxyl-terminal processing protease
MAWSGPLVVLISKFSASASEILAGAIQDYDRGLIIGDHATHGKGTVQSLVNLDRRLFFPQFNQDPRMGALKITMQQFYRPCGKSTQKRGVESDIELPSLRTYLDIAEADLDYPVEFDEVERLEFEPSAYVNDAVRDRLRTLSDQRCSGSEKFKEELEKIARYQEFKARKYVTLNEEEFLKERAELNTDEEEKKTIEELNGASHPSIERDQYLDEAMAVVVDYLNLQHVAKAH